MRPSALWLGVAVAAAVVGAAPLQREPLPAATPQKTPSQVSVLSALNKFRAEDPLPRGAERIALDLARGECEQAQVAVSAGIAVESIALSPLAPSPDAAEALRISLYRVGFIETASPSNDETLPGRWPDPLIPERSPETGKAVRAFGEPARADEPTLFWVEICAPAGAAVGLQRATATLRLSSAGARRTKVFPVEIRVRAFTIPATSSLRTSFGFSGITAARAHGLPGEAAVGKLARLYAIAALEHRVSLHGLSMAPPDIARRAPLKLDFTAHDRELEDLLEGRALASGARLTSFDVRLHPALQTDAERLDYLAQYAAHLQRRGWLDRAFLYAADEPAPEELRGVRHLADLAHRASPGLKVLVTHGRAPELDGAIDLFAPNLNCLFERSGADYCRRVDPPLRYGAARRRGGELWWYQSCGSHGCVALDRMTARERRYFRGWPSYMVDHDAALNRAMGALAFEHGIDGELYFNTVEAWNCVSAEPTCDPWRSVWRFQGNGEGTFFYPGRPDRLGAEGHFPIASIRLKHVRDGLEDFEYLRLAQALGIEGAARRFTKKIAAAPWDVVRDPEVWQKARAELADAIEAALSGQQ